MLYHFEILSQSRLDACATQVSASETMLHVLILLKSHLHMYLRMLWGGIAKRAAEE